jgi:ABC-type transport system substrate-binding protein
MESKAFDDAFLPSRGELDAAKRLKLLQQAGAIWHEELPAILLMSNIRVYATQANVVGFQPTGDGGVKFNEIARR